MTPSPALTAPPARAELGDRIRLCETLLAEAAAPGPADPHPAELVGALDRCGLLQACVPKGSGGEGLAHHPDPPEPLLDALVAVGRGDLSAGRLFEGHVNALKLIAIYGTVEQQQALFAEALTGRLFGVWGADAGPPARIECAGPGRWRLEGRKRFASGLGVIGVALMTAADDAGRPQLVALSATRLQGRTETASWSVSGMRATRSGSCRLDGLMLGEEAILGRPGDYHREPHFQGGVWRYAAVQLGGLYSLIRATTAQLEARGQAEAPLQSLRLRRMLVAAEGARLWLRQAARAVEHPRSTARCVPDAVLARLHVAEQAVQVLALADEALGAASFDLSHPAERVRRDLQFYLRQANPDGLGQAAMDRILQDREMKGRWGLI